MDLDIIFSFKEKVNFKIITNILHSRGEKWNILAEIDF